MVKKRTTLSIACALVLCLAGCSGARKGLSARLEAGPPGRGRLSGPVTLLAVEGGLAAVYADRETTSLVLAHIPDGPLSGGLPPAELLVKIDMAPPLAPEFGEHSAAASGDTVEVLYLDREAEDRSVLKLAVRSPGSQDWRLDIVEPPGRPVAMLPLAGGSFGAVWADSSSLLYRPASGPDRVLRTGFRWEGRGCVLESGSGFTVFDGASGKLLWYGTGEAGPFARGELDGAGPVHAATLRAQSADRALPDGLAVASYDPAQRRIFLFEEDGGGKFAKTTVTICDGTRHIFCAPWGRGYLFLFDEVRPLGGGRTISELSLLAPEGPRYRRKVISAGPAPITGLGAIVRGGTLTVAIVRDSLTVLRVTLTPPGR